MASWRLDAGGQHPHRAREGKLRGAARSACGDGRRGAPARRFAEHRSGRVSAVQRKRVLKMRSVRSEAFTPLQLPLVWRDEAARTPRSGYFQKTLWDDSG